MAEFTNVLVTDTFDQWRIKTNNIGADVTALIGTVETDLDGFRTEIGNTISAFETELDTTLSSYVTLATDQTITGAKTFTNGCEIGQTIFGDYIATDNTTINSRIELGYNQTSTKHQSYIDFHSDDSDADFASRIGRWNDGRFEILNKGTGALHLNTSVGTTIGANIELYGDSATTGTKNNIYYDATNHYFRDKNGANSGLTVNSTGISTTKLTINSGKMKLNNLDYTWPSSRSGGRYLRTDANGILSWEAVAGGTGDVNVSTLVFNDIVPVGTIMPWAGASEPTDGKWKFCDGEEVLKTAYPELTTILGGNSPKYGTAANGYIKLPDLEQKVPVGAGGTFNLGNTGGGLTANGSISGSTGGTTLTAAQSGLPVHNHAVKMTNDGSELPGEYSRLGPGHGTTQNSGINGQIKNSVAKNATASHSHSLSGSVSTSTLQPYLVTKYIIKVLPDDVQQVSIEAGNGINVKDANSVDTGTLDLFSTKIELLADTTQFKFNTGGQLQLVTPAVSQSTITSQISTAVSGLASTGYVDSVAKPFVSPWVQAQEDDTNQTITHNLNTQDLHYIIQIRIPIKYVAGVATIAAGTDLPNRTDWEVTSINPMLTFPYNDVMKPQGISVIITNTQFKMRYGRGLAYFRRQEQAETGYSKTSVDYNDDRDGYQIRIVAYRF